ncbi:MAG: L-ribulose-5-phosphate 4-epimerase [Candidatus Aminicenantes bacterium RBG_19FT_COMBO_58_17]|jgi:L-ribulose-5-phosphate 4-epimerase|nr:MAG: L-ribulose-5-phosphate 4-epimerase [Candidatus Aminicenantes bacterium RBG_19FT_COMBO_58_17]
MLSELKEQVWRANLDLVRFGLATLTFGNASGLDRQKGIMAIKPSGISYEAMKPADIVLVDLAGERIEGRLSPSSDTPTHLELYRAFPTIGGIAHAHSEYATMHAQACREIPCLGTTHADFFNGPVPVTRFLNREEVEKDYELNTGKVIRERFRRIKPLERPGVLVAGHGPFAWGRTPGEAVENCLALERIAKIAMGTRILYPLRPRFPRYLLDKHFQRKHGPGAYYGQKKGGKK